MDGHTLLITILMQAMGIDKIDTELDKHLFLYRCYSLNDDLLNELAQFLYDIVKEYASTDVEKYKAMLDTLYQSYLLNVKDVNNEADFQKVSNRFLGNTLWGFGLTKNFIENISYEKKNEVTDIQFAMSFLNDHIRYYLGDLNRFFVKPKFTYKFFENYIYGDTQLENQKFSQDVAFLKNYYYAVIRLIYADVYELILALDLDDPQFVRVREFIEKMVNSNDYELHPEYRAEGAAIFDCYYYLTEDIRLDNHDLLTTDEQDEVRKINPLYLFDSEIMNQGR